jgi:excinuclease ABC subunit C
MNISIIQKIESAPTTPGVYLFYKNKSPLYIGKASNLRARLRYYLKNDDLKIKTLRQEANNLKLIKLFSPIEALIEESRLIKMIKPRYNVLWRDDKNYSYIAFTKEKFPKVYVTHQPKIENWKLKIGNLRPKAEYIGPFTDGASLKITLKTLRRYFPYCTCLARHSFGESELHRRQCLNAHIGNCLGACCSRPDDSLSTIDDRRLLISYRNNIRNLKNILSGKNKKFLSRLQPSSEMIAVENIMDHSPYLENDNTLKKIECYDVSNFAGKEAVGAMTTLNRELRWTTNKNDWRKFKIKTSATRDDPRMIAEIFERRLNHPEWPYPDLIVIDGGVTQYNAANKVLNKFLNHKSKIRSLKLISFAKPNKKIIGLENLSLKYQNFIKQLSEERIIEKIINQTHHFVINYHRQKREVVIK